MALSTYESDPRLFLFTSLTAGSSHITTATSRMETILKANKLPFQAVDVATDEVARKLWGRRAGGRKLPGLVREGWVLADLEQTEEWNEFGELKENVGPVPGKAAPLAANAPKGVSVAPPLSVKATATGGTAKVGAPGAAKAGAAGLAAKAGNVVAGDGGRGAAGEKGGEEAPRLIPGAEEMRVRIAAQGKEGGKGKEVEGSKSVLDEGQPKVEKMRSAGEAKEESIEVAKEAEEGAKLGEEKKEEESAVGAGAGVVVAESAAEDARAADAAKATDEVKTTDDTKAAEATKTADETKTADDTNVTDAVKTKDDTKAADEKADSEHRGSEVKEAPAAEIEKVESQTSLTEAGEEDPADVKPAGEKDSPDSNDSKDAKGSKGIADAAKGVESLQVGEDKATQEQGAKAGEEAGKSVED